MTNGSGPGSSRPEKHMDPTDPDPEPQHCMKQIVPSLRIRIRNTARNKLWLLYGSGSATVHRTICALFMDLDPDPKHRIKQIVPSLPSSMKGGLPVAISTTVQPRDQMSAGAPYPRCPLSITCTRQKRYRINSSVADPDPGSGAFLTLWIRDG